MDEISHIRARGQELQRLHVDVQETSRERQISAKHWERWQAAVAAFHNGYDRLTFPQDEDFYAKLRAGDAAAIQSAVNFLIADPYYFRSGYVKQELWQRLNRCAFNETAVAGLEQAARINLNRTISREFWPMCRVLARIGREPFWERIATLAQGRGLLAIRAQYLLNYHISIHVGERARRRIRQERSETGLQD